VVANISRGEPEYAQADPNGYYRTLEDTSELVSSIPLKQAVTQRYKLAPLRRADRASSRCRNHRLFSACAQHLVVLNSDTGEIVELSMAPPSTARL